MRNNVAERASWPIAPGGKNYFLLVPTAENGDHQHRIETAKLNDVEGVLSDSRSKAIMAAGSLPHISRAGFHAIDSRAGTARKQSSAGVA